MKHISRSSFLQLEEPPDGNIKLIKQPTTQTTVLSSSGSRHVWNTVEAIMLRKIKLQGQKWLIVIQSSKQGTRGRDAPWRHKLDPSVWDQVQIILKSLLLSQPSPQTHLAPSNSLPLPPPTPSYTQLHIHILTLSHTQAQLAVPT